MLLSFASYNFNILLYLITALFICLIAIITINKIFDEGYMENYYVLAGIILFVLTLVISAIILPVFIGPTSPRYLVPVSGVLWLSLSIIIDKIEKEKILTIILILLLLMGCLNFISILESTNNIYQSNQKEMNMLNEMNNENSVVIHTRYFEYQCYHDDLNKTKEYSLKKFDTVFPEGLDNQKDVAKIMDENPGKTVYMIDYKDQKINQNVKKEVIANKGAYSFTKLSLNNTNSST